MIGTWDANILEKARYPRNIEQEKKPVAVLLVGINKAPFVEYLLSCLSNDHVSSFIKCPFFYVNQL